MVYYQEKNLCTKLTPAITSKHIFILPDSKIYDNILTNDQDIIPGFSVYQTEEPTLDTLINNSIYDPGYQSQQNIAIEQPLGCQNCNTCLNEQPWGCQSCNTYPNEQHLGCQSCKMHLNG